MSPVWILFLFCLYIVVLCHNVMFFLTSKVYLDELIPTVYFMTQLFAWFKAVCTQLPIAVLSILNKQLDIKLSHVDKRFNFDFKYIFQQQCIINDSIKTSIIYHECVIKMLESHNCVFNSYILWDIMCYVIINRKSLSHQGPKSLSSIYSIIPKIYFLNTYFNNLYLHMYQDNINCYVK